MKTRMEKREAAIEEAKTAGWDLQKIAKAIGCPPSSLISAKRRKAKKSSVWLLLDPWLVQRGFWTDHPQTGEALARAHSREASMPYGHASTALSNEALQIVGERILLVGKWLADPKISRQRRTDQLMDLLRDIQAEIARDRIDDEG